MKYVTVMCLPGRTARIEIGDEATVKDACDTAGFDTNGYQVTMTSNPSATLQSIPANGDQIVLSRQAKGA